MQSCLYRTLAEPVWVCLVIAILLLAQMTRPFAAEPGLTPAQIEGAISALDSLAPDLLPRSGVPGMAVAIVSADAVLYLKGFGIRRLGAAEVIDTETVFQLASLSKPLTSTVVAGVVDDEIIDWNTPVGPLVPELMFSDPSITRTVTVADLLAHRSGLPGHAGDLLEDLGYDQKQIFRRLRHHRLAPFRIHFDYTNFGFTAAALAAARAAGMNWAELAETRLFSRVGMTRSSYRFADYLGEPNHATLHAYEDGRYQPLYQRNADAQAPAGGASASVADLAIWLRLQLNDGQLNGETIIDAAALLPTHLPQVLSRPAESSSMRSDFYGLGWNVSYDESGRVRLNHSGAFLLGAATNVTAYPGEKIGIVVLTNGAPYGLAEATARSFYDLLFEGELQHDWLATFYDLFVALWAEERAFMKDYSKPPERPTPARANRAYAGRYTNPYYGRLDIIAEGANLTMRLGPDAMRFPLAHWDGDIFVFETTGENALGLSGAQFAFQPPLESDSPDAAESNSAEQADKAQKTATTVTLERYNQFGLGVFQRVSPLPGQ